MKVSQNFLLTILAAVVLVLAACYAPAAPIPSPTPATSGDAIAEDDWTVAAIANLSLGYSASPDVWHGYDPREHPSVAVYKSGAGAVESVLVINFS